MTVLFADVVRSMELAERLDADRLSELMQGLFAVCRSAVESFGGTVDKFTGDGVMALFGAPVAQEDHARRAAHAALRLLEKARDFAVGLPQVDLALRVGLNSGEVVAGSVGEAFTAIGHTVGLAQRMESLAEPNTVRVSAHTAELLGTAFGLRDLGARPVKGAAEPLRVYALEGVVGGPAAAGRRAVSGSARLIGRGEELAMLTSALAAAQGGEASVIGIVGEAGAGKSRLCAELAVRASEFGVTVRRTAGVSHAQDVPLLPILGFLRDYFGISDADDPAGARAKVADRIRALDPDLADDLPLLYDFMEVPDVAGAAPQLGPEARQRRVLDIFRRVTARRSEQQALVLILEDLHWFDAASVQFLAAWLPSFRDTRTLVVTNFRPEFTVPWLNLSFYRHLPLRPLGGSAVLELLDELLGLDPSLAVLSAELRARTGGNPFFVEEIVRGLASDGTLSGAPGAYRLTRDAGQVQVPATVQAVLAERIDRLEFTEKAVLQAASVIGRVFSASVLAQVTGRNADDIADVLAGLCGRELLHPGELDQEYRFWHPLTQEVAYGTLLGATRRSLHATVAETLIGLGPERHDELAALLVTHFDAAGDDLEVARWQLRAGARAMRSDVTEARVRWRAAIDRASAAGDRGDALRIKVRAGAMVMRSLGRSGTAGEAEEELVRVRSDAQRLGDQRVLIELLLYEAAFRIFIGQVGRGAQLFEEGTRAVDRLADTAMQAFSSTGWSFALAYVDATAAVAVAERAVDLCGADTVLGAEFSYSMYDSSRVARAQSFVAAGRLVEAREGLQEALSGLEKRPQAEWRTFALCIFPGLADATGDPVDAQTAEQAAAEAMRLARDSNNLVTAIHARSAMAIAALLRGRVHESIAVIEEALGVVRRRGGSWDEAELLVTLARAQLALGAVDAARTAADQALRVAAEAGATVVESWAQVARARVFRTTATCPEDLAVARAAVEAGQAVAQAAGAVTCLAFLAEEGARLDDDPLALKACIDGYAAIGASGHAQRVAAELQI